MSEMRAQPMYTTLVADGGVVLSRRVPSMGASGARMVRAENQAVRTVRRRSAQGQEAKL